MGNETETVVRDDRRRRSLPDRPADPATHRPSAPFADLSMRAVATEARARRRALLHAWFEVVSGDEQVTYLAFVA